MTEVKLRIDLVASVLHQATDAYMNEVIKINKALNRIRERHWCVLAEDGKGPCDVCDAINGLGGENINE